MAAVTQESIPPLRSTTACLCAPSCLCVWSISIIRLVIYSAVRDCLLLNTFRGRIPYEFVELQSQPHRQAVCKNPFHQRPRLQPLPFSFRTLKDRRKKRRARTLRELML